MSERLEDRKGLPEALRLLADELPRSAWVAHPAFHGLTEFWLQKHLSFRRLCAELSRISEDRLEGRLSETETAARIHRFGGMLIGGLHDHHSIEDHHYFPKMQALDPRLEHGFALLDADHHALDPWLARLTDQANAILSAPEDRDAVGRFHEAMQAFDPFLARHLEDEEDLIVPVILRHGMG